MERREDPSSCGPGPCGCGPVGIGRREFLAATGLAATGPLLQGLAAVAGPFEPADFEDLVPRDKKLDPVWVRSLTERGHPEVYRGAELGTIGMPVGGIACGQLYLGGDGRLWHWEIFQSRTATNAEEQVYAGPHYAHPMAPKAPLAQGFAIRVLAKGKAEVRRLDATGFADVSFRGEYPIGRVTYQDGAIPVEVALEAFSPFIPLDADDSSLPATVLAYEVRNNGDEPVEVTLAGWLENATCPGADDPRSGRRRNTIRRREGTTSLIGRAERLPGPAEPGRPDVVFADFEGKDYGGWKAEGDAFGDRPYTAVERGRYDTLVGFEGKGFVNSHNMRRGEDSARADAYTGKLVSPEFKIDRRYITFRIGGGRHPGETGLHLVVDGEVVRRATGEDRGPLRRAHFDVRDLEGRTARLEVVDSAKGGWGHTTVDQIVFADAPSDARVEDLPGYGSLALTLLDGDGETLAATALGEGGPGEIFERLVRRHPDDAVEPFGRRPVGALGRSLTLAPGASARVTFVLSWWFPYYPQSGGEMAAIADFGRLVRHYARRFADAGEVADYVAGHLDRLAGQTRLWNRTWYDSTLPYWFLDRTFIPADCLATQTFHAFDNGRYWGWEGVDCCAGTCQHVWYYAQAVARLFPSIERDFRDRVDFGLAWHDDGAMDYRAENAREVAIDGFAGTILRVYREHQASAGRAFLVRLWPRVRKSLEYLMAEDRDADGLLEGRQMNTLDAPWFGPMGWISSLYLAALAAGEAMAAEMGDPEFAARCRRPLDAGRRAIVARLFNGEYFIHKPDPAHPEATSTNRGCHIDQVLGQSWAFQVGLPRVVAEEECRSALKALWTYNFTPDVGPYREGMKGVLPAGRLYAMPGEGGLLMCTWPRGGAREAPGKGNPTFVGYFNECMTGFEYQVAAHMIWEGLVREGLAVVRTIHDRYHPRKRNPYNEVECSDHYARAMMSYGAFLAACGFEHHGPGGHIGFAPRLTPDDFRAPFTAAEGWGTFAQRRGDGRQRASLEVRWGRLRLRSLAFRLADGEEPRRARVTVGGREVGARHSADGPRVLIRLDEERTLVAGDCLEADIEIEGS